MHSSLTLVTHSGMRPAARYRATTVASCVAMVPTRDTSPDVCGMPFTAKHSLTEQGTPVNGGSSPSGRPLACHAATASSAAAASSLASSYRVAHTAFRNSLTRWFCTRQLGSREHSTGPAPRRVNAASGVLACKRTCWMKASTTSADVTLRSRMSAASCVADLAVASSAQTPHATHTVPPGARQ